MNHLICGTEDSRLWDQADTADADAPLTSMETRLQWLCDDWRDALINDSYDDWRDMRMMIYGAIQTLNQGNIRGEDRAALSFLGDIAFNNSLRHISRGAA